MQTESGRVGLSFVMFFVGAAGLGACVGPLPDQGPMTTGTGGSGSTIAPPPGGVTRDPVSVDAGAATCVADGGVTQPPIMGGGVQPAIPATITRGATPVPPLSGGTLLALADGTTLAASDPERDQVYLVDTTSNTVRATVALQPGDEPGRLVEDAAGLLHVALRRGGAIATIDPAAGTLGARQAACTAPRGIAYQPDTDQLHVACAGGELVSLPAAGGAATRTLTLDRDLRDVVMGPGGSLLVSTFRKAELLTIGAGGAITGRQQPGSGVVPTIMGAPQMRTPSVAWRMVSYDATAGSVVMLHQTGVVDTVDPAAGGYAGLKGCGGIVQPGVSLMTSGGSVPPVAGGLFNVSLAIDVALSPDRQRVAVAVAGNTSQQGPTVVEMPQAATMMPAVPCGGSPSDITTSMPPGQVVAVAYAPSGVLFAQTREPAAVWRADTGATTALASDSLADTGHFIFHVNAGGGLACASCHPEGGEDGRVWNFACVGARRTQSIRGGISATAPFHWDGTEHDFSGLMDDVFSGRMAGPRLDADHKAALAGWIDTIPALPPTAGLDAAAVARGHTIFTDPTVGCATCHAGTLFTNNLTVDVGTGQAFQVPSLRGVSWRAPFLHNGCATTLADRFTSASCGGGDRHGATSKLTAAQLGDLEAYLQSL